MAENQVEGRLIVYKSVSKAAKSIPSKVKLGKYEELGSKDWGKELYRLSKKDRDKMA